jgi:multidrug efflux pump subunit AcrA (membrane-fusion protein)
MKKVYLTILILGIAIALFAYFQIVNRPIDVEILKVSRRDLPLSISVSGSLSFSRKIDVYPKISGMVKEVRVKPGDKVKKGDILAIIDAQELKKQMDQIKNMIDLLKISTALKGIGFQQSDTPYFSQDQLNTLENYYESLKSLYEERIVRAPISGIIAKINITPGETIKSQEQAPTTNLLGNLSSLLSLFNLNISNNNSIITIIDPTSLVGLLKVDENNILKIKEGQDVEIYVDALEENPWRGKITSISMIPSLNKDGSYSYEVSVNLPQLGNKVVEGMSISATINIGIKKNVIVIPLSTISFKEGKTYVYTVENGKAKRKEVVIGDMNTDYVEIKEGLKEGDFVILSPLDKISDNSKIRIYKEN